MLVVTTACQRCQHFTATFYSLRLPGSAGILPVSAGGLQYVLTTRFLSYWVRRLSWPDYTVSQKNAPNLASYIFNKCGRSFYRSYLKANTLSKSEGLKKVKYACHFESVLMLFTKTYQNYSMLVETTLLAKIGVFFLRHSVYACFTWSSSIILWLFGLSHVHRLTCYSAPDPTEKAISVAFVRPAVCPSVCLSRIANNSRTQRPSVPKFGTKVPHLRATLTPVSRSNGHRSGL